MKKIAIIGGSGFVGRALIQELLTKYPEVQITSISRSEGSISRLLMECDNKRLNIEMMDMRDSRAISHALSDKDTVIHLAAMKRVDLSEQHCREATSINVIGTMNLINAFKGKTFILMSTDKAVEPCNCYGATKLISERLILERARKAFDGNRFMIGRSGNILESTGSVMDIWKNQIERMNEITVTDLNMVRYYTSVEDVVKLFIAVLENGENGKLYLMPHGEPQILRDIVTEAIKRFGNENTKIRMIGLRDGERMVEKLRTDNEKNIVSNFA